MGIKATFVWVVVALLGLQCALASARHVRDGENGGPVVVMLTKEDFNARLQKWEVSMVAFVAKWCTESQALLPKIEAAAKELHHAGSSVQLAQVDATQYPEVRHEHRVSAFPTIVVFIQGQRVGHYGGAVSAQAIRDFVEQLHSALKFGSLPKLPALEVSVTPNTAAENAKHLHGHMMQLTEDTFDAEVQKHQFAVVNFGANWCKWTRALLPEFAKASEMLSNNEAGVLLASVDCEQERRLEHAFFIRAFPTMLVFRCGRLLGCYTGARTADGIAQFVEAWVQGSSREGCAADTVPPQAVRANIAGLDQYEKAATEPKGQTGDMLLAGIIAGSLVAGLLAVSVVGVCCARYSKDEDEEPQYYWWHYAAGFAKLPPVPGEEIKAPEKSVVAAKQPVYEPVSVHDVMVEDDVDSDREEGTLLA